MSVLALGSKSVCYTNDTADSSYADVAAEVWSWRLTESTAEFNSEEGSYFTQTYAFIAHIGAILLLLLFYFMIGLAVVLLAL